MLEAPTRERLITEAMRLFGEHGYRGTSVAQIEGEAYLAEWTTMLTHRINALREGL
jgi:AcrR family transcriptional regulator